MVGHFSIVLHLFAGLFAEEHQKGSPCDMPAPLPANIQLMYAILSGKLGLYGG